MICFLAMIVFGILGIFSATYRKIALEAFNCVFRKITLRKCQAGLDIRLKSKISGKLLRKNPKFGKFVYKNFQIISSIFTFLLIASFIWTAISGYNYYNYGNCNGPSVENQGELCIFDPAGKNSEISTCDNEDLTVDENKDPTLTNIDLSSFPNYLGSDKIKDKIVYVGCYTCPNTRKVNPLINKLIKNNKETIDFTFVHLPLHKEQEYLAKIMNCLFNNDKSSFWQFHNQLMNVPLNKINNVSYVKELLNNLENGREILICSENDYANTILEKQLKEIKKMNIKGTPTIFINNQTFIGAKPYRVYEQQLSTHFNLIRTLLLILGTIIVLLILYFAIFKRNE